MVCNSHCFITRTASVDEADDLAFIELGTVPSYEV
jgi:hypothetical protein